MNKRYIFGLLLPILALSSCGATQGESTTTTSPSSTSQAQDLPEEPTDLTYFSFKLNKDKSSYSLVSASPDLGGKVVVPSTYEGKPITIIAMNAFEGCAKILEVVVLESNLTIEYNAFIGCSNLSSIRIPSSTRKVESGAFEGCVNMIAINVDEKNEHLSSKDGILFNKDQTSLLLYPLGKSGEYVIPENVTLIGGWAFHHCEKLTSISFPESLLVIRNGAFSGCVGLSKAVIPSQVSYIGDYAFDQCPNLASIDVAEDNPVYESEDGVLFDDDMETLLLYPEGKEGAYTVPEEVLTIAEDAFSNCHQLTSITISEGVRNIDELAFLRCSGLTSVSLPDTLLSIDRHAFKECDALESIVIPSSVAYINTYAFSYCETLTSIEVAERNRNYASVGGVLFDKEKSTLLICPNGTSGNYIVPEGVASIGEDAFSHCRNLTSITLSSTVSSIGYSAFSDCVKLAAINANEDNQTYSSSSGVLFSKDMETAVLCPMGKAGAFVGPEGLKRVGADAFFNCVAITSAVLPEGLLSIDDQAFMFCENLASLSLPASLTYIGESAFDCCSSLTEIVYNGTKSQWNEIEKDVDWNCGTPLITVHCADGDLEETYDSSFED